MTSSNGDIFRVTGPLCGEFTGPGEFPAQRPVTRSFDVFFDLRLDKSLSKQPWGWWFETQLWSLWRQCNDICHYSTSILKGAVKYLGCGLLNQLSPFSYFPNDQNTGYLCGITFIFDMCHRSWSAATPEKYEHELGYLNYTYHNSNFPLRRN